MSKLVHGKHEDFVETEATITHKGHKFTSGGSYLLKNKKTKKLSGILYAYPNESKVGTWDGKVKFPARFEKEYHGNMGDLRQVVHADIKGKKFVGTYYKQNSDIVRVQQVGSKKKLRSIA